MTIINWIFDYRNTVFIAAFDHNDGCNDIDDHDDFNDYNGKSNLHLMWSRVLNQD